MFNSCRSDQLNTAKYAGWRTCVFFIYVKLLSGLSPRYYRVDKLRECVRKMDRLFACPFFYYVDVQVTAHVVNGPRQQVCHQADVGYCVCKRGYGSPS